MAEIFFYILACLLAFVLSVLLYDDYQANCSIFANSVLERDSQCVNVFGNAF